MAECTLMAPETEGRRQRADAPIPTSALRVLTSPLVLVLTMMTSCYGVCTLFVLYSRFQFATP